MQIKRLHLFFIFIAATTILFFAWRTSSSQKKNDSSLELTTPSYKNLEQFVKASGTLKAKEQLIVGSLVNGRVMEWYADANDTVQKGQLLAKLDDGIGYAAVEKALAVVAERSAEVDRAEQLFERLSLLLRSNAVSQDDHDKQKHLVTLANARLDQAKAELKMSQRRYENLSIKAPDEGTIIARKIDVGQMVTAQLQATELFIIAKDLHHMEATIDVDEADIGLVKPGQDAFFVVDAFPTLEFKAKVLRAENLARSSGTVISYSVILNVENPELKLRPGMTTNVQINVASSTNVLAIPQRALRLSQTGIQAGAQRMNLDIKEAQEAQKTSRLYRSYIWIKDGKALKQTHVKLGVCDTEFVEVLEGVTDQTQVVSGVNSGIQENNILKRFGPKSPIGGK